MPNTQHFNDQPATTQKLLFLSIRSQPKKKKLIPILASFLMTQLTLTSAITHACTSIVVGRNASASGNLFISRNEDFTINSWAKHIAVREAKQSQAGDTWILANGLKVPAPQTAYRYTAMPDWNAFTASHEGKSFEERGINEFNVAISATNSAGMNEKAKKADPLVELGITEQVIPSLILPQAKTARQAVKLLGKYIKKYGAEEANGIQIADDKEIWYMEIGSGHHWLAVKVPDDVYVAVSNSLRIHDIDLSNSDGVLHSDDLFEFVTKHKLLANSDKNTFNFAKAFGVIGDEYNTDREWLAQKILSPSIKQKSRQKQYPLFMSPDEPISVADIAKVLRSNYTGTELDGKAERSIGVDRNSEAHIIEINARMPEPLRAVIWQTPTNSLYSPFIPIFNTLEKVPAAYQTGTDHYGQDSAWWTFRALGTLTQKGVYNGKYKKLLSNQIANTEKQMLAAHYPFSNFLKKLYKTDPDTAVKFASDYSRGLLDIRLEDAKTLYSNIMTDLTRSTEKNYSPEEFEKIKNL